MRIWILLSACVGLALTGERATAQVTRVDSAMAVYRRAQRLVNDGQGAEGRALVDSMLNAAELRSPDEAEALYWRAMLAESWGAAQRDYLRLMLEHERLPRAGDAMLRLAQGESARGDREAAVRYLERLALEAPDSPARAEGGLWHGRLLIDGGNRERGCATLRETRGLVRAGAIELENQYDYLLRGCPAPGAPPLASDTLARATSPEGSPAVPAAATSRWSVQVGALSTATEAGELVRRLRARGYEARVDGSAPFRVRFGRFPTRAEASVAAEAYRAAEKAAAFVVEVPRG